MSFKISLEVSRSYEERKEKMALVGLPDDAPNQFEKLRLE